MINAIIEAISVALSEEFGEKYEIYMEEIKQGLKEPCFFIFCPSTSNELIRGQKYSLRSLFCIHYFPETEEKQREINDVAERMMQCLEHVTIDGDIRPARGTKMRYEAVDGVLNFFVNYDRCFYRKKAGIPEMEELESSAAVKGGD